MRGLLLVEVGGGDPAGWKVKGEVKERTQPAGR